MPLMLCSVTEPEWIHDTDEPFLQRRDRLPEPFEVPKRPGLWDLIKDFVGMDLAKVLHGLKHSSSSWLIYCEAAGCMFYTATPAPPASVHLQIADLSLPVAVCEPVTDMQRRGDFLEYAELLHEVGTCCLKACAVTVLLNNVSDTAMLQQTCRAMSYLEMHSYAWDRSAWSSMWHS